jgi:hypothetical protein
MHSTEHDHRVRIDLMDLLDRWQPIGAVDFVYVEDVYDEAGNWVSGGHWWVSLGRCAVGQSGYARRNLAWNLAQGCWLDTKAWTLQAVTKRLKS